MQKETEFRLWLHQMWLANCDEHDFYGEKPYSMSDYWHRYKWFLKGQYRKYRSTPEYVPPEIRSIMRPPPVAGC